MGLGYIAGKLLKLNRERLGAFIVVSGFGSSSTLGYPLIRQIFPGNEEALTDALIIGELGACLPFFIIGVFVIMLFGKKDNSAESFASTLIPFLKSPIFIGMTAGLLFSFYGGALHENAVFKLIIRILDMIGNSLMLLVALSIGLMLRPISIKVLIPVLIVMTVIKLVIEPLLSLLGAGLLGLDELQKNVLFIEAAMPSGAVASVFADRYGCDGHFASVLVLSTYIISMISLPVMFYFSLL